MCRSQGLLSRFNKLGCHAQLVCCHFPPVCGRLLKRGSFKLDHARISHSEGKAHQIDKALLSHMHDPRNAPIHSRLMCRYYCYCAGHQEVDYRRPTSALETGLHSLEQESLCERTTDNEKVSDHHGIARDLDSFLTKQNSPLPPQMCKIAECVRRFYHPAAIDEMLSTFVPLISGNDLNVSLSDANSDPNLLITLFCRTYLRPNIIY